MIGILKVSNGESRIDGTLLGRKGGGDPYGAATAFLDDHDCHDSDCVTVTGTQEADAFYIDSAVKEETSKCQRESAVLVGKDLSKGKVQREAVQPRSKKKATKSAKGKGTRRKASTPPTKQRVSQRARKKKKKTAAGKGRRGRIK